MKAFCWYCGHRWKSGEILHRLDNEFICGRCFRKAEKAIFVPSEKLPKRKITPAELLWEWGVDGT